MRSSIRQAWTSLDAEATGPRACEVEACGRPTRYGKAACSDHVDQLPYYAAVLQAARAYEAEVLWLAGACPLTTPPAQLVAGLVAADVRTVIRAHGCRTPARIAVELDLPIEAVLAVVVALQVLGEARLVRQRMVRGDRALSRSFVELVDDRESAARADAA
ncbi:MAG: hypothetical protein M9894_16030 [Planctomycetes bacterium]|nr:hypothetical protein [Planctomycetota bacterium]